MTQRFKLLGFLLFATQLIFAQAGPSQLFEKILADSEKGYTEKVYLHTDKPFYNSEETIWYKSYLVNAITHTTSKKSRVLYVDLINPKDSIVFDAKLYVSPENIGVAGDIKVSKKWETGNYQLRAYTNYMRNEDDAYIFRKPLYIKQVEKKTEKSAVVDFKNVPKFDTSKSNTDTKKAELSKLDLKFYPEGGLLIQDKDNVLGLKLTDVKGNGIKVNGYIREKKSKRTISYFRTFEFGLGKTSLKIAKGTSYEAVIETTKGVQLFDLPAALASGKKISIDKQPEELVLHVVSNQSVFNHFILGHQRGKVIFNKVIQKNTLEKGIRLVTDKIPSGVVHFTLFNPAGKPLSERLVFIDNKQNLELDLNKNALEKRSRVEYTINKIGKKFDFANLSVAVTSKETVPLHEGETIKSWLLLNSDLRGEVANTAAFFDPKKSQYQKEYLLESLMLTHGWRRFTWDNLVSNYYKKQEKIAPELGMTISGQAFAKKAQYAKRKIQANLFFLGKSSKILTDTISQKEKFKFGPFYVEDTLKTMLVGKMLGSSKKEEKNIVLLFDKGLPRPKVIPIESGKTLDGSPFLKRYEKKQEFFDDVDFTLNGENILGETILSVEKKDPEAIYDQILEDTGASYGFPTDRVIADSIGGVDGLTAIDLLNNIPSVRVSGAFPDYQISVRGGNSSSSSGFSVNTEEDDSDASDPFNQPGPLFLLDGTFSDIDLIASFQASDVAFIDVLAGADAAVYGGQGADGVIAVYLKNGAIGNIVSTDAKIKGAANILTTPFYKAKEFYDKNYLKGKGNKFEPDYRSTIHWKPNWNISKSVENTQVFYTSDETGMFQISVQGLTNDGKIIQLTQEFEVYD